MKRAMYHFKSPGINIYIDIYFDGEKLVVEGQDIGKAVAEYWGDSDYEYIRTLPAESVAKLRKVLHLPEDAKEELLEMLCVMFSGNNCFSELSDFLEQHNIESEYFSWA